MPADKAADFVKNLKENGIPGAVEIGEVLGATDSVQLELVG